MTIHVFSKAGCGICDSAKEKLERMGLSFETHDIAAMMEMHDGWREDGSVELMAAHALLEQKLPVIKIDDKYYDYPGAMRRLRTAS